MSKTEVWKFVPGFPDYEVSDMGRIRSWKRRSGKGTRPANPTLLNPSTLKGKDYLRITISNDKLETSMFRMHQLVLLTFRGPCPLGMESLHNDGNGKNNVLTNLRYGTKQENADDRVAHGTQIRGETCGLSVLTDEQVEKIKETLLSGKWKHGTGRQFALEFGVSDGTISSIKRNRTWNHI